MAIADVLFLPWPSWAKLGFVLGGLLVIVGCIAGVVKVMKWRKMLRLEKATSAQAERGEMTTSVGVLVGRPFGVRALDEDSSIEGVWNAHTSTPLHGPSRNSSPLLQPLRKSKRPKRDISTSSIPTIDLGEPSSAQATVPMAPRPPHDEPAESPEAHPARRKKTNSITINYSGPSSRARSAAVGAEAEKQTLLTETSYTTAPSQYSSSADGSTTKMRVRVSPKRDSGLRKFVIGGRSHTVASKAVPPVDHTDVIRRMEAHRRLHSAESGQLTPRLRPKSEDNATVVTDYCACDEDSSSSGYRTKPKTVSQTSIQSRAGIIEGRAPTKLPPSAWTRRTRELLDESMMRQVSVATTVDTAPSLCSDTTYSTAVPNIELGPIENKHARKVNDGFEILPAGTFSKEPEVNVLSVWPDVLIGTDDSHRKGKRLKKHKRATSNNSQASRSSSESQRSGRFALMHAVY
ncbi:uncharacterized protein AB675_6441 [Cyphellophora attinorum]|uniref:Uncharacterized protein n=1 Tax=Cyphellophora attinorum TaxID=1664694 RepID=A0A0N0NQM0_9EURO|nr:uncharacterized protein AB675_6441 [Phialophora attinorum]KPI43859.1 hypothetical protein AB675_6441 [Phialophora attinorum]